MKIQELFESRNDNFTPDHLRTIRASCNHFLETTSTPLMRSLKTDGRHFMKVKVRLRKNHNDFTDVFNEALFQKYHVANIHQRSIFANGPSSFESTESNIPYYVFPIDGFKFLYSVQVKNSTTQFNNTFESLSKDIHDDDHVNAVIRDLMIYTYTSDDLERGIVEGSEIVMYNVPYYYAVNADKFVNYKQLLNTIKTS
jgi:hypothetical protein